MTDVGGQEIKKLEEQGLQPKYLHFSALSMPLRSTAL